MGTRGYFFFPSPTANLVGVVKKLRKSYNLLGGDLLVLCTFDFFNKSNKDVRSSQRNKKFRHGWRNFLLLEVELIFLNF